MALGNTPAALLSGRDEVEAAFEWRDLPAADGLEWLGATPKDKESAVQANCASASTPSGLVALDVFDNFGQRTVIRLSQARAQSEARRRPVPLHAARRRRCRQRLISSRSPIRRRRSPSDCGRRPSTEVIGQRHLLDPGKPLAVAFASKKPHSMILWGPPGVGKTTLARLMADAFNADFIAISAVLAGVKDIRDAVAHAEAALAQSGRHTILFVDEVHRFNKAQQDAFLPFVERGLITFIGATTENPSFEVNNALLSRAAVYVLEPLSADELGAAARPRAGVGDAGGDARAHAREALIGYADGDGRRLINLAEQLSIAAGEAQGGARQLDLAFVGAYASRDRCACSTRAAKRSTTRSRRCTSRSAAATPMHRCTGCAACSTAVPIRSTSDGGMIRMASEDIGLADPRALQIDARRGRDL